MCKHTWKSFESDEGTRGYNSIRQCVNCGAMERYTHIIHDDGQEFFNRTVLRGPY